MTEDFDDFVNKLQNQIYDETREEYGDVVFERWRNPLFCGTLENADGYGKVKGTCGDTMEIFLKFENDRVKEASFRTDGCGTSGVCGSFAAELAHGKNPDEIADITGEYILSVLGDLPEEDRHCAFLASASLQEALDDYMKKNTKKGG
ncbi:MAG: iron-sulfur cluster assembly scaffold protein [Deltaproteobacteria bacterium]|nr:iron-sulfur cluster assembly scaffold protein [Deltaproteobacteria bacterium]